jgi:soluble lytic murein transglycosylase-like protein
LWRRSLRAVRARGIALIVGLPLAFGALEFPIEAMNMSFPSALKIERVAADTTTAVRASQTPAMFPIFTTRRVREQFLNPEGYAQNFTLEVAREHFFRTHVPYGPIIYREAKRHNLPPELVAAVVAAESDFRPKLISHKNAQGLMQLIPSTGRLMGAGDLFNPAENIAAGTKYLRYLFNRFGDEHTVLAAYNAGEGNVARFGGVPPFAETRNYISKVNRRTRRYREGFRNSYIASVRMQRAAH